jgi:two-component system, NarL family, sensor kinase
MNEMTPESVSARDPPRFRLMMAVAFVAVVALACIIAAALLLWRAGEERGALRQEALRTAVALSRALDQEVAAMNYLLKGLSTSPALRTGDLKAFYDQLTATSVPEGSWLILHDLEGQVLNTLRPFGAALPRHSDYRTSPVPRIREVGWAVSGRTESLLRPGASVVGLSLRVDSDTRPMTHFLTTIVSDLRLRQIMTELGVHDVTHTGAFDRDLQPLFAPAPGSLLSHQAVLQTLRDRLAGAGRGRALESLLDGVDERGNAVLIGLSRSVTTDWTSVTVTPAAAISAPLRSAVLQIAAAFVFLLTIGGVVAHYMSRHVEKPLHALASSVTAARQELGELSEHLLVLQEEERRRIARELHDSTAQHLVAGTLGLMQIAAVADGNPAVLKACAEVEASLDKGLRELRIFTYLLHPPNLEREGLSATLREFVDGFCRRTGLAAAVRVSGSVDYLPFDLQRTLLRVVQEALANVQRHAMASRVSLVLRQRAGRVLLRVSDNGKGIADATAGGEPQRFGVGIRGMRARLKQFGGELRIKTKSSGTTLVAVVPLTAQGRDVKDLVELADSRSHRGNDSSVTAQA